MVVAPSAGSVDVAEDLVVCLAVAAPLVAVEPTVVKGLPLPTGVRRWPSPLVDDPEGLPAVVPASASQDPVALVAHVE